MINTLNPIPEIKSLQLEAALGKLDWLPARFWSAAHDTVIYSQKMNAAGIPIAFIFLILFARIALRTSVIGKILQTEFTL